MNNGTDNKTKALRDINLEQKKIFRQYLQDSIKENIIDFKNIVSIIGKQWGVKRTVSIDDSNEEGKDEFDAFIDFMFNKLRDINNKKNISNVDFEPFIYNSNSKKVLSYPSKLYFLFSPDNHKVIYDTHNCEAVAEILKLNKIIKHKNDVTKLSLSKWTELINKNYDALKTDCKDKWGEKVVTKLLNKYNPFDVVDCYLWIKGNPDFQKSK